MFTLTIETSGTIGAARFDREVEILGEFQTKEEALSALERKYDALGNAQKSRAIPRGELKWLSEECFVARTDSRGYRAMETFSVRQI